MLKLSVRGLNLLLAALALSLLGPSVYAKSSADNLWYICLASTVEPGVSYALCTDTSGDVNKCTPSISESFPFQDPGGFRMPVGMPVYICPWSFSKNGLVCNENWKILPPAGSTQKHWDFHIHGHSADTGYWAVPQSDHPQCGG